MKNSTASYNFSNLEIESLDDQKNKIELVSCKGVTTKCTSIITNVNVSFRESELFRKDKNYVKAIEELKEAYMLTFEFTEITCFKCGELFRTTIIESLENIGDDLKKCSKGLFKRKDFQSSIQLTEDVIQELKALKGQKDKL